MRISLLLFTALVLAVGSVRLLELNMSRRRQAVLVARGARPVREPYFGAMVALHIGTLLGCLIEAWMRASPPGLGLSAMMLGLVLGANLLRWWVIATLGPHWNVQIMASLPLGVVTEGPFRWVRHPNYAAVFIELLALPLVHGAWISALGCGAMHAWVLYHRIRCEEAMLMRDDEYRARMSHKPRFIPGLV